MNRQRLRMKRRRPSPSGFTMVELLVVITIIVIMASAILFALATAAETARIKRTQATIARLNSLLMEFYDDYTFRRLPIQIPLGTSQNDAALMMLKARRDEMRLVFPDRWSDVSSTPVFLTTRPALSVAYKRKYDAIASQTNRDQFQGAECLYLIITVATAEGQARALFKENEIGDVDGDGASEFLDGWGQPISFLRWPAGFIPPAAVTDKQTGNATSDHDPFDPLNRDPDAYRLVPLIYSGGPDQAKDIIANNSSGFTYSASGGLLNAYPTVDAGKQMGAPHDTDGNGEENWHDNIHNHLIGLR